MDSGKIMAGAVSIALGCTVLGPIGYFSYQSYSDQETINRVIGCRALKGESMSEDHVRRWMQSLKNDYDIWPSEARAVVEEFSCKSSH